jgi:hypothetical protein
MTINWVSSKLSMRIEWDVGIRAKLAKSPALNFIAFIFTMIL